MPGTGERVSAKRQVAGTVRRVNFDHSGHDDGRGSWQDGWHGQQLTPQRVPPAWLAALDVDGELTFLDVAPILVDGPDQVLAVLWHRTNGKVDRLFLDTDAGSIWVYVSRNAPPRSTPPRRPSVNPHGRRVLRELGADMSYCCGPMLFLAADDDDEAGLSSAQRDLLSQLAGVTRDVTGDAEATQLLSRVPVGERASV